MTEEITRDKMLRELARKNLKLGAVQIGQLRGKQLEIDRTQKMNCPEEEQYEIAPPNISQSSNRDRRCEACGAFESDLIPIITNYSGDQSELRNLGYSTGGKDPKIYASPNGLLVTPDGTRVWPWVKTIIPIGGHEVKLKFKDLRAHRRNNCPRTVFVCGSACDMQTRAVAAMGTDSRHWPMTLAEFTKTESARLREEQMPEELRQTTTIQKSKGGRPRIGKKAMSNAEMCKRYRKSKKAA